MCRHYISYFLFYFLIFRLFSDIFILFLFLFFLEGGFLMFLNEFSVVKFVSFDKEKSSLVVQGFRSDFNFNLLCHSQRVDPKFFEKCSSGDLLFLNIRNSYNVKSKNSGRTVSYPLVVGVEKWDSTFTDNLESIRIFLGIPHED